MTGDDGDRQGECDVTVMVIVALVVMVIVTVMM